MPAWSLIVVLAFACAIIAYSVRCVVQSAQNDAMTETSAEAKVVSITGRNRNMITGLLGGSNSYFQNVNREYYVTFELLPGHTLRKFTIPVVVSPEINEGDTGLLTFQGTRFISFT